MRKILISILLASAAAAPAFAAQDRDTEHRPSLSDRKESRAESRPAHDERSQAREQFRAERAQEALPAPQLEMRQQVQDNQRGGIDQPRFDRGGNFRAQREVPQQAFDRPNRSNWTNSQTDQSGERQRRNLNRNEQTGNWTGGESRPARSRDLRQGDRPLPNVMRARNPLIVSETPREGTQPPLRAESRRLAINWSTGWRNDQRYDWRRWRERHRSIFRIGIYYDPFGWGYRPYQIGWRLWPGYYGRRYWIDDPYEYRLPYAPPGTVWVRYWDDALLVDTWTGEVIDVIHNFFW